MFPERIARATLGIFTEIVGRETAREAEEAPVLALLTPHYRRREREDPGGEGSPKTSLETQSLTSLLRGVKVA